jgi:hypothetical protein
MTVPRVHIPPRSSDFQVRERKKISMKGFLYFPFPFFKSFPKPTSPKICHKLSERV